MSVSSLSMLWNRLLVAAGMPAENYPPSAIAAWIKSCKEAGRDDLGKKIMDWWNHNVLTKYPHVRVNWGAATKIGMASVKKNIFGGMDFVDWIQEQGAAAPVVQKAKKIPEKAEATPELRSAPKLTIPDDGEQPEDWQREAEKTKVMLDQGESAFNNAGQFYDMLLQQATEIEQKIEKYKDATTSSGKPHKFQERVPKWEAQLKVYKAKIQEVEAQIKKAKAQFANVTKKYNHAPATTVKFEQAAQQDLQGVLEFIMNMSDVKKQKEMLAKFNKMVQGMDESKAASMERSATFWDKITEAWDHFTNWLAHAWKDAVEWVKGLFKSIDKFEDLVTNLK